MSVSFRLIASLAALIACAGLLGGAALAALFGLSGHYHASEDRHRELRSLYEVGHRAATMQMLLAADDFDADAFARHVHKAIDEADRLPARVEGGAVGPESTLSALLRSVESSVRDGVDVTGARPALHGALSEVAAIAARAEAAIVSNRLAAAAQFRRALMVMGVLFALCGIVAVVVGVAQYRAIMGPIRALDRAAENLAAERFARVRESGDLEFRRLMRQFNRMSGALEDVNASMRGQVETKTRLLMRSEQLASVGRLAAGLAHEINNPLAIIAGHAEATLRAIRRGDAGAMARVEHALQIVCDEAFRCSDITRDLLDMTRATDVRVEEFRVRRVMERAIELVRALPVAQGQSVRLCGREPLCDPVCRGTPGNVLQAALNLLTNALEACEPGEGVVLVDIRSWGDDVEVSITDNGCGMSVETMAAAFDPFFTDKPRKELRGAGLGLSLAHAIIERHGGRLEARSEGAGRGSAFVMRLPLSSGVPLEAACTPA